jgi:hypothetical protein
MVIDVREDYIELATGCQLPLMSIRVSELFMLRLPFFVWMQFLDVVSSYKKSWIRMFPFFLSTIYPTCFSLHVAQLICFSNRNIYPASNMI